LTDSESVRGPSQVWLGLQRRASGRACVQPRPPRRPGVTARLGFYSDGHGTAGGPPLASPRPGPPARAGAGRATSPNHVAVTGTEPLSHRTVGPGLARGPARHHGGRRGLGPVQVCFFQAEFGAAARQGRGLGESLARIRGTVTGTVTVTVVTLAT
jgi:hypothetical protein